MSDCDIDFSLLYYLLSDSDSSEETINTPEFCKIEFEQDLHKDKKFDEQEETSNTPDTCKIGFEHDRNKDKKFDEQEKTSNTPKLCKIGFNKDWYEEKKFDEQVKITQEILNIKRGERGIASKFASTELFRTGYDVKTKSAGSKYLAQLFPYLLLKEKDEKVYDKTDVLDFWGNRFHVNIIPNEADNFKNYLTELLNCAYGYKKKIEMGHDVRDRAKDILKRKAKWNRIVQILEKIVANTLTTQKADAKEPEINFTITDGIECRTDDDMDETMTKVTKGLEGVKLRMQMLDEGVNLRMQKLEDRVDVNESKLLEMSNNLQIKHPTSTLTLNKGDDGEVQLIQTINIEVSSEPNSDKRKAEKEAYKKLTDEVLTFYNITEADAFLSSDYKESKRNVKDMYDDIMNIIKKNNSEKSHIEKTMAKTDPTADTRKRKLNKAATKVNESVGKSAFALTMINPIAGALAYGTGKCTEKLSESIRDYVCTLRVDISKVISPDEDESHISGSDMDGKRSKLGGDTE